MFVLSVLAPFNTTYDMIRLLLVGVKDMRRNAIQRNIHTMQRLVSVLYNGMSSADHDVPRDCRMNFMKNALNCLPSSC